MINKNYRYKSTNRNTTLASLEAAVVMLVTDDKDVYVEAYHVAMHDNAGLASWNLMYTGSEHIPGKSYKSGRRNK